MIAARSILLLSFLTAHAICGVPSAVAQGSANEVAYVEFVTGEVVALTRGKSAPLDVLDTIDDQTELNLPGKSELRICHFQIQKFLILRGPLRATVSYAGVTTGNGRGVEETAEPCVEPTVSAFQGGIIARTSSVPAKLALRPRIKIVNRTGEHLRKIVLWDDSEKNIIAKFEGSIARPSLEEGRYYHLVIARADGSELRAVLRAGAANRTGPFILVIR